MNSKKNFLLLLTILASLTVNAVDYWGEVGDVISLPNPTVPISDYQLYDMTYSSTSSHLYVYSGTSSVKIVSYFSGTEYVRCDYRVVRQWSVPGSPVVYEDWKTLTTYFNIRCSSSPDPDPDPDPDPTPDEDTYSQEKTKEGYGMWFCFTKINNEKVAVAEVPPFLSSSNSCIDRNIIGVVTIPSVAHGLPVRRIASGAFKNINGLTKLIIPSSVKYIAENSIYGCNSLESITCENPEPPTGLFLKHICSEDSKVTLYVPSGSVSKYKSADGWKNFKEIKEIGADTEDAVSINNLMHEPKNNVVIYNLNGQRVASPKKGLYIRNGKKVLMR